MRMIKYLMTLVDMMFRFFVRSEVFLSEQNGKYELPKVLKIYFFYALCHHLLVNFYVSFCVNIIENFFKAMKK